MAVALQKGGNVSLSKQAPGLQTIAVGLGWDSRQTTGADFDLDASVFMLGEQGKVPSDSHFIFYNNLTSPDGSIEHQGDNLTGEGEGDDEVVNVNLGNVPSDIGKIVFTITIHDAEARRQNFGMVQNAFIRIVNLSGGQEVARYDLAEDFGMETAMIFGELYRYNNEWKFRAVGQGFAGGLEAMCRTYGVNIG